MWVKFRKMEVRQPQETYIMVAESYQNGNTTTRVIASDTGIPQSTVARYLAKFKAAIPVEEVAGLGRPRSLSRADTACVTSFLSNNQFVSSNRLCQELEERQGRVVCSRTVRNELKRINYKSSIPRVVPFVTPQALASRVRFASENRERDWRIVCFSDETMIQLDANITRAWHPKGARPSVPRKKFPAKIMFWSAVSTWFKFDLVEIEGTMTATKYVEMLRSKFIPWVRKQRKRAIVFQQDNAPSHTARHTKAFFEEDNIVCLDWPPYSPDLNPIENLWGILKQNVDARKPRTLAELRSISQEEWKRIPMDMVRECINSMPRRLSSVIESNGEQTGY